MDNQADENMTDAGPLAGTDDDGWVVVPGPYATPEGDEKDVPDSESPSPELEMGYFTSPASAPGAAFEFPSSNGMVQPAQGTERASSPAPPSGPCLVGGTPTRDSLDLDMYRDLPRCSRNKVTFSLPILPKLRRSKTLDGPDVVEPDPTTQVLRRCATVPVERVRMISRYPGPGPLSDSETSTPGGSVLGTEVPDEQPQDVVRPYPNLPVFRRLATACVKRSPRRMRRVCRPPGPGPLSDSETSSPGGSVLLTDVPDGAPRRDGGEGAGESKAPTAARDRFVTQMKQVLRGQLIARDRGNSGSEGAPQQQAPAPDDEEMSDVVVDCVVDAKSEGSEDTLMGDGL